MLRTSRMSLTELPSTSLTCRPRPSASATSTLRTSSSGLSTGLVSGSELLDTSPVLSPELDVLRVLVALALGLGLQVSDVLGNSVKLILEVLSILGNLVALGQKVLLSSGILREDFNFSSNVLLQVHGSG